MNTVMKMTHKGQELEFTKADMTDLLQGMKYALENTNSGYQPRTFGRFSVLNAGKPSDGVHRLTEQTAETDC